MRTTKSDEIEQDYEQMKSGAGREEESTRIVRRYVLTVGSKLSLANTEGGAICRQDA